MRARKILSAVVLVLGGCSIPGDRAAGGMCPDGETCAPETPNGLYFRGEDFFNTLGTTAVNGVQVVSVLADENQSFTLPFDAVGDGPAFRVLSVDPPNVTIQGISPGTSKLRILKRGTQLLFDRVSASVAAIARVTVTPAGLLPDVDSSNAWGVLAGADVSLAVWLYAGDDTALVDDTTVALPLNVAVAPSSAVDVAVEPSSWWSIFRVHTRTAGSFTLTIEVAGTSFDWPVFALDRVTDIEAQPWGSSALSAGQPQTVCFTGLDDGIQVSGLSWTYSTTTGGVSLVPAGNCVDVTTSFQGSVNVAASALGFSKTFVFTVAAPKTSSAASAITAARGPTPGERAHR